MLDLQLPSPAPYVIAVTGHRDLRPQDVGALREAVRKILVGIRSRVAGRPLLLLSGLAEGADQLAAEVALELGVPLGAVLPMPLDIYRVQMPEAAQKKLDELLALAKMRVELPLEGRTPEHLRTSNDALAACYEALALFLVRHGQALIALWDGKHSDKPGGTCRVVQYARFGATESGEKVETRCEVVYHVMTSRLSGKGPAEKIRTVTLERGPIG
jgi:predicted RecB family endonuclease